MKSICIHHSMTLTSGKATKAATSYQEAMTTANNTSRPET